MNRPPPPLERRTYRDFVAETEAGVARYTGAPPAPDSPGHALVRIFARMAEQVAERINQAPHKNFLAYLDLLGVAPLPPQPARVPLTFSLAAGGAADAVVPARTPVAAVPLPGETEPVVFETERELLVTRTALVAAFSAEPRADGWADHTAALTGAVEGEAETFRGPVPVQRALAVSFPTLFPVSGAKRVSITLDTEDPTVPWPALADWSWWDGTGWRPASAAWDGASRAVTLDALPAIPIAPLHGRTGAWLRAVLRPPMRRYRTLPTHAVSGDEALDPAAPRLPFGPGLPQRDFHLASPSFGLPRARVTLHVTLEDDSAAEPRGGLELAWEYSRGNGKWGPLGVSNPADGAPMVDGLPQPGGFAEDTRAFTRSGTVRFDAPPDWAEDEVAGATARWLRVRVAEGEYAAQGLPAPPAVRRVEVSHVFTVPGLRGVSAAADAKVEAAAIPAAFANATRLDLTKDVFPFGERPRFGDVLHLALPGLEDKPGAKVRVGVTLTNYADASAAPKPAVAAKDLVLRWEYWSATGARWTLLGESGPAAKEKGAGTAFSDATAAFTVTDPKKRLVSFTLPADAGPTAVNGVTGLWVRARIAGGSYGRDPRYEPVRAADGSIKKDANGAEVWVLVQDEIRPPSLRALDVSWDWASSSADPDRVMVMEGADAGDVDPSPAAPLPPYHADDGDPALYLAFRRPGDAGGFSNAPNTIYVDVVPPAWTDDPGETEAGPAHLAWEYWNGTAWADLAAHDETEDLLRRGLVGFTGPTDHAPSTHFGVTAFWVRARLASGGWRTPPRLRRVLANTTWASHVLTVPGETLGSGTGERNLVFRTTRAPVLPGHRVEVLEPEHPSGPEREAIVEEEGPDAIAPVANEAGAPAGAWVRWHAVPDFYGSGPRSRHYVLDWATGEVRFGDGRRGLVPPRGKANVRMASYRTGGGPAGNRPAGNVTQLKTTVPYVDKVTNLEPARGGTPAESMGAVMERGPRQLRHRDRAVTAADYEDLAMEATPEVALARAVGASDGRDAGRVRLIVVPRGTEARPIPSVELLERVRSHLAARMPASVALDVTGPEWRAVGVAVEVVAVADPEAARTVRPEIAARLAAYLHPLTGGAGGAGWPLGVRPHRSELYALVESTPGVDHVRRLAMGVEADPSGDGLFLVYSGEHRVSVSARTDD